VGKRAMKGVGTTNKNKETGPKIFQLHHSNAETIMLGTHSKKEETYREFFFLLLVFVSSLVDDVIAFFIFTDATI
ncbi:hypothetical protein KEM48_002193, partial [Puccinia striiformis f. sp. tritici PST-130]